MVSPYAPRLLFRVLIKAFHSDHRLALQAGDVTSDFYTIGSGRESRAEERCITAAGTAYIASYNFSSVKEYQQWPLTVLKHICVRYHLG